MPQPVYALPIEVIIGEIELEPPRKTLDPPLQLTLAQYRYCRRRPFKLVHCHIPLTKKFRSASWRINRTLLIDISPNPLCPKQLSPTKMPFAAGFEPQIFFAKNR